MRFVVLLNNGARAETTATTFFDELLERSTLAGELCLEFAAEFVNECLKAIGFRCNITRNEIDAANGYNWPDERNIYTFLYNAKQFAPFERFLVHICAVASEYQKEFIAVRQLALEEERCDAESANETESPIDWLMQLLAKWCNVYKALQKQEQFASVKYFEEPLARINFQLLVGMHKLRKEYRLVYPLLDNMCDRFYRSAVQGIFYQEAHNTITIGLLDLFEYDFDLFYQHSVASLNFYYEAFTVDCQKATNALIYQRLQNMLNTLSVIAPSKLLILTNFLIEPHMLANYFTTLRLEKSKRHLLSVLKFMQILQSKLITLDCFCKAFIESILALTLNSDQYIAKQAAELYITMMQRKFSDDLVMQHILEFYLNYMRTPDKLVCYVNILWPHFTYMQRFDVYLELIVTSGTVVVMRFLAAHFLVAVYEHMQQHIANHNNCREILMLLQRLPQILAEMTCIQTSGVLLQIFAKTAYDHLQQHTSALLEILYNFENYAVQAFTHAEHLEQPLLLNLLTQLNRCLNYTNNWHKLEDCAVDIYRQHLRIERSLCECAHVAKPPSVKLIRSYCNVLQKLNILLKTDYEILDSLAELCDSIGVRLLQSREMQTFASRTNSLIDAYAIEILVAFLKRTATTTIENEARKQTIAKKVEELTQFLLHELSNEKRLLEMPLMRIAMIFNSLNTLYTAYSNASQIYTLTLQPRAYHLLTATLTFVSFKMKDFNMSPINERTLQYMLRVREYQKFMFHKFTHLHATATVFIPPVFVVWKLCLYYGLPQYSFQAELGMLLQTLATQRLDIYKHIVSVVIFNLHRQNPPLLENHILRAIKAHNTLIDRDLCALKHREILKVHIVLCVLQIIEKSVKVLQIDTARNRLVSLKYLTIFVDNLNVSTGNVLVDVQQQTQQLQNYLLTATERKYLKTFKDLFAKF